MVMKKLFLAANTEKPFWSNSEQDAQEFTHLASLTVILFLAIKGEKCRRKKSITVLKNDSTIDYYLIYKMVEK
jgi:hypothetical protein